MDTREAEHRVARLGRGRKILYALLPVVLLLLAVEGGARIIEYTGSAPRVDLDLGFNPDIGYFDSPYEGRKRRPNLWDGTPEETTFAAEKPPGTFRIFTLGGSSVAFLQDHLKELEKGLNRRFEGPFEQIQIINAGAPSFGSQRVLFIAREALTYDPDLLVLYTGHNEFEDLKQMEVARLGLSPLQEVLIHSAACRLLWAHWKAASLRVFKNERNLEILRSSPNSSPEEWEQTLSRDALSSRMEAFHNNLRIIARLCRDEGVPLITGTVPSNHWEPSLLDVRSQEEYGEELVPLLENRRYEAYHAAVRELLARSLRRQSSDTENAIIRAVADEFGLPLADVRRAVRKVEPHGIPGETLFDDCCHLNEAGNDVWIETYTPLIRRAIERAAAEQGP